MNRRTFIAGFSIASVAFATGAFAASLADQIVAQLRKQGYRRIRVSRTLLGRIRITASTSTVRREIIVNPRTGEILRDFWERLDGSTSQAPQIIDPDDDDGDDDNSGSDSDDDDDKEDDNSGSDDDDDDKEDDNSDDDDDDDDESSDNSGHGNSDD